MAERVIAGVVKLSDCGREMHPSTVVLINVYFEPTLEFEAIDFIVVFLVRQTRHAVVFRQTVDKKIK
ncbi:Unknown protein sequence [Pseudomonas syringae pv. maculicola]|nr:Unknown protein sequence [Pseudomonas syringae pv. maculicola]